MLKQKSKEFRFGLQQQIQLFNWFYLGIFRTRFDKSNCIFLSQVDNSNCRLFQQQRLQYQQSYDAHTCIEILCHLCLSTLHTLLHRQKNDVKCLAVKAGEIKLMTRIYQAPEKLNVLKSLLILLCIYKLHYKIMFLADAETFEFQTTIHERIGKASQSWVDWILYIKF